jgi:hypothetical protein
MRDEDRRRGTQQGQAISKMNPCGARDEGISRVHRRQGSRSSGVEENRAIPRQEVRIEQRVAWGNFVPRRGRNIRTVKMCQHYMCRVEARGSWGLQVILFSHDDVIRRGGTKTDHNIARHG